MLKIKTPFIMSGKRFEKDQIIDESEIPAIELKKMLVAGRRLGPTSIATPKKAGIAVPKFGGTE